MEFHEKESQKILNAYSNSNMENKNQLLNIDKQEVYGFGSF